MKSVLITGASGFLGRYIVDAFPENEFDRCTIGRSLSNSLVCDLSTTIPVLKKSFDLVVHAMGKAHVVPTTEQEASEFIKVNVDATRNLCQSLEMCSSLPGRFVFISSVAVYGVDEGNLINENTPLNGKTPYAKSKIMAEDFLRGWCSANGVLLTILRLPLIAGVNPPGNLGSMIAGIKSGKYFNIGKGSARKSVVLASDVAAVISTAAKVGGTYNLTDGEHPSFSEIANCIAAQLGKTNPRSIPLWMARLLAFVGDLLGSRAPINSDKLCKVTSSLIFDDKIARATFGWNPSSVVNTFKIK